jgi:hypothetical protein
MGDKMTVLVLESDTGAADSAIEQLEGEGHAVVRCHERNAVAFPCNALVKVVTVLSRSRSSTSRSSYGRRFTPNQLPSRTVRAVRSSIEFPSSWPGESC